MEAEYRANQGLDAVPPYAEDTGEVNWLVEDAIRMEVPVPVIAQAVMQLLVSRDERKHWARAVAMMRHGFGGHPYGRDESIARERHKGRLGGFEDTRLEPHPPSHSVPAAPHVRTPDARDRSA